MKANYSNKFGLFDLNPKISFSSKHLGLLVSRNFNSPHNILVWKRFDADKRLFTSYKYKNQKNFWISDFSIRDNEEESMMTVVSFKESESKYPSEFEFLYGKIHLAQYRLGNFQLISHEEEKQTQPQKIVMDLPFSHKEMWFVAEFTDQSDLYKYLMFGLLLLLIMLAMTGITFLRAKNGVLERELRNDLAERQMRDQTV